MTRTVEYTHSFKPSKPSAVVDEVFYDSNARELYVRLHSGAIAGYGHFTQWRYDQFKSYHSAGKYWNWYVKDEDFPTLNGDVNLVPFQEQKESPATTASSSDGKKNTTVIVRVEGDLKFDLDADDVVEAVKKVKELIDKSLVDGISFVKEVKVND